MATAALTCRPEATARVMPASMRMLPMAGIGSGVTPAPNIWASAVDCAAIEPASWSASTMRRMARPSMRPIDASTMSMRRSGRPGSVAVRAGASMGQTTMAKATATPSRTRAGITCSPKPGRQRHDAGDAREDEDEAGEPGLGEVEERAEALVHQARPRTAGRAPAPISSKEKTGLRMPLAMRTVCRKRRRLVEVTTAG